MTKIAIITGATSGLGREFAKRVDAGEAGYIDEIWAFGRRATRLEALVRTLDTPVRPFCLDLCDPMSFDLVDAALEETPDAEVRLLVNNAGAGTFGPLAKQCREDAQSMMALLMRAPVELIYRALPYMAAGSRIIDIASVAAFTPQPGLALYSSAKRFVLDMTRALNAELTGTGITACAVCPKFMRTEFLAEPGDAAAAQAMTKIGFEKPENVAAAALAAAAAGRDLCIPSLDMKAYYALSHVLPYRVQLDIQRALGII